MFSFLLFLTAFHLLFWHEGAGMNLPVFATALLIYSYSNNRTSAKANNFLMALFVFASLAVVLVNSSLAIAVFFFVTVALHGSFRSNGQSIFEQVGNGTVNFLNPSEGLVPGLGTQERNVRLKGMLYFKFALVPTAVFLLYFLLFLAGNSIFNEMTGNTLERVRSFFGQLSLPYMLFLVLGAIIARWAMRKQWLFPFRLEGNAEVSRPDGPKEAGKYEYRMVVVLFVLLNALYLIVNFIDVKWVWFGFYVPEHFSLKQFVHEGVGWLIATLLISMALVLYYFRGDLNFYPANKPLKWLAYGWIFQNVVLAISVAMRTLHYIGFHGLAPGRAGVVIFIFMVLFGLGTLLVKIYNVRSLAYVIRLNSAFVLAILTLSSLVPWGQVMARYNLRHEMANEIDVDFYLEMGPSVYPLLYDHLHVIEKQINAHMQNETVWIDHADIGSFKKSLDAQSRRFLQDEKEESLASWNLPDHLSSHALAANPSNGM